MIGGIQQNVHFRLSFMYIAEIKGKISIKMLSEKYTERAVNITLALN